MIRHAITLGVSLLSFPKARMLTTHNEHYEINGQRDVGGRTWKGEVNSEGNDYCHENPLRNEDRSCEKEKGTKVFRNSPSSSHSFSQVTPLIRGSDHIQVHKECHQSTFYGFFLPFDDTSRYFSLDLFRLMISWRSYQDSTVITFTCLTGRR